VIKAIVAVFALVIFIVLVCKIWHELEAHAATNGEE